MRTIGFASSAVLSLVLGIAAPVCAQRGQEGEKQDHAKPEQSERQQAKPEAQHAQPQQHAEQQQQHAQPQQHAQQQQRTQPQQHAQQQQRAQQQQHTQPQQRTQQHAQEQHAQQQRNTQAARQTPERQRVQQTAWQQHRSQNWQSDHRTWEQRGGYRGYRIPDDRFRGYFGPSHGFRINVLPFLVVGGFPRFQYQGYWFSAVDPWPEYWGNDWYNNDDVYVNYVNNGYYLYNRRYPSAGVAINVTL